MSETTGSTLAEQFEHPAQQQEASEYGIWTFLATEVLFFGGLFLSYGILRLQYHEAFSEGSRELYYSIGTINTFVLLTSSLFMALAVHAIQVGDSRKLRRFLALTFILGAAFLGFKLVEYGLDYHEHLVPHFHFDPAKFKVPDQVQLFLFLYFAMTGLHAIHMTIGLAALTYLYLRAGRGNFSTAYHTPVKVVGLYWHFVDIVWVFLYPMLYMVGK